MVEQDYIMRLIKEMVRTLMKLLFDIEMPNPATELLRDTEESDTLQNLLEMIDNGKINEAENRIYEMTADGNMENLKVALIFYAYLNEKSSDFLERHNFSREEVEEGLRYLIDKYDLHSIADTFLSDTK